MLKKFKVKNYRNFQEEFVFDFTDIRDYQFNTSCIKNGIINTSMIYGKNSVGKSNLGKALLNIRSIISEDDNFDSDNVLNAYSTEEYATFDYTFILLNDEINYIYLKNEEAQLVEEELIINGNSLYKYNYLKKGFVSEHFSDYSELDLLNFEHFDSDLPILRYITANAKLNKLQSLKELRIFIEGMALLKPSDISASFLGPKQIRKKPLIKTLITDNMVSEFEDFLETQGINLKLEVLEDPSGETDLYISSPRKPLLFRKYASSGTRALVQFFHMFREKKLITFLFVDEYDANLHTELSGDLLKYLRDKISYQLVITTHNTDLMSNKYLRPDCYNILTPWALKPLFRATKRELREGHNLEKLYQSGEFDEF